MKYSPTLTPVSLISSYKGYTIHADRDGYKILGSHTLFDKLHVLRRMAGSAGAKKIHDHHGNRLYTRFESLDIAIEKAKAYIDEYPDRLELSLTKKQAKKNKRHDGNVQTN